MAWTLFSVCLLGWAVIFFMPTTETGRSDEVMELAQFKPETADDVEAEKAQFGQMASKAAELAKLLRVLRGKEQALNPVASPPEPGMDEESKGKILDLLNTLQSKVSPLDAVRLGISVTMDDLVRLGVPDHNDVLHGVIPNSTQRQTVEVRTLVDRAGADAPGSFGAGAPWTGGVVPFCFHSNVPDSVRKLIEEAMLEYEKAVPCIQFKQTNRSGDFSCEKSPSVIITSFDDGCFSSHLGLDPSVTQQQLNLQARKPENRGHCEVLGIAIHELGHVLGMAHEQSRPDRDDYVTINWDNIYQGRRYLYQFRVVDEADHERAYDVLSVMHYGSHGFSRNGEATITPRNESCWHYTHDHTLCEEIKADMGQRFGLTQLDADQLGDLYRSQNPLCRSSLALSEPSDGLPLQRWLPRSTQPQNTMYAESIYPFHCKEAGHQHAWTTVGGGKLEWKDGNLAFYEGDGAGHTKPGAIWQSGTCAHCHGGFNPEKNPGTHLCFQWDGNLLLFGHLGVLLWATGTYPGRVAPWGGWKMQVYDHHWVMLSPPRAGGHPEIFPYSMVRYPRDAPSSVEILPWHGCLSEIAWTTPGGARLEFRDGDLRFYPGDGQGNTHSTATWYSGTQNIGERLCFEEGNLEISSDSDWVWRSGTFAGGRWPDGAVKIIVFDVEWSMFSAQRMALVTYPPSTNFLKMDHFSAK